jgi:hypothetical protein
MSDDPKVVVQTQAAQRYMMAMGCREQAKQAAKDGFDPNEWLQDAVYYQEVAARISRDVRLLMGIEK